VRRAPLRKRRQSFTQIGAVGAARLAPVQARQVELAACDLVQRCFMPATASGAPAMSAAANVSTCASRWPMRSSSSPPAVSASSNRRLAACTPSRVT
jgi:hypothetical protein